MATNLVSIQDVKSYCSLSPSDTSEDALLNLLLPDVSKAIETSLRRTIGLGVRTDILTGYNTASITTRLVPIQGIATVGDFTFGSAVVTNVTSIIGLFVNQSVLNANAPSGAIIQSIGATSFTMTTAAGTSSTAVSTAAASPIACGVAIWNDANALGGSAPGAYAASTMLIEGQDYWLDYESGPGSACHSGVIYSAQQYWQRNCQYNWGLITPQNGIPQGNIKVQYNSGYLFVPQDIQMACLLTVAKMRYSAPYGQMLASESYEGYAASFLSQQVAAAYGYLSGEVGSLLAPYRTLQMGGN